MSILSDRQIRNLCVPPLCTYINAVFRNGELVHGNARNDFFGSEEDFNTFCQEQKERYNTVVVRDVPNPSIIRPVFKPMIEPFADRQVREVTRRLNKMDEELRESAEWLVHEEMEKIIGQTLSLKLFHAKRDVSLSNIDDNLSDILVEMGVPPSHMSLFYEGKYFRTVGDFFQVAYESLVSADDRHTDHIISYGLSSYGYDLRLGNKFKVFTNVNSTVINPKAFDKRSFVDIEGDVCIVPPNSFVLGASLERIVMPKDVTGVVLGKSTYARCGIDCLATPLEAGWEGHVTLEFANTTPLPAMLFAGEGCCQVLFLKGDPCDVTYAMRNGKYQNQEEGPVTPRV